MITINIKIWKCEECGYQRETDGGECPECNAVLVRKIDGKSNMTFMENSDIEKMRTDKIKQRINIGTAERTETSDEKTRRIDKEMLNHQDKTIETQQKIRTDLESSPSIMVSVPVTRLETDEEATLRINKEISNIKIYSATEINDIKEKFE